MTSSRYVLIFGYPEKAMGTEVLELNLVLVRHGLHGCYQIGTRLVGLFVIAPRDWSGLKGLHQSVFDALETTAGHALLNEGFELRLMNFDIHGGTSFP